MEYIEVLKRCIVEGNIIRLPKIYVDRWSFIEVKKKLEAAGGKWDGIDVNGFVFDSDPTEVLASVIKANTKAA